MVIVWYNGGESVVRKWLTTREFGEKYGISRQRISGMCKAGELEHKQVQGMYLIPEDAEVPASWMHGKKGRVAQARYEV